MERQWVITHLSVHNDGEMCSYLEAICDTKKQADKLMYDIYYNAARNFKSRQTGAVYSNPKWLDEEHEKLQVNVSLSAGYSTLSYTETYFLSWVWKEKTVSPKWILE